MNPDIETAPFSDKITNSFRQEVYQQIYSSVQKGIRPSRDALVFALFHRELNAEMSLREATELTHENMAVLKTNLSKNGVELVSKAGHKGVYYDLPKFYVAPAEVAPKPHGDEQHTKTDHEGEIPQLPNFFPDIPNDDISSYLPRFKEGTAAQTYIQYVADALNKGTFPTEGEIKKHFSEIGLTAKMYENSKAYLGFRFRQIAFDRKSSQKPADNLNPSDESTTTKIENFFKGIPNDDIPDPDDVFSPNTLSHKYLGFVINQIREKGVLPSPNDIKKHLVDSGAPIEHFEQIRTAVEKKVRGALGPAFDAWKSRREIVNGFPVITPPERPRTTEPVLKHSVDDGMLWAGIQLMHPELKAAASTIFSRTTGKSISEADWIAAIQKENPDNKIGPADLPKLIREMREQGDIKVFSIVSDKVTYYYRRSDNNKRI